MTTMGNKRPASPPLAGRQRFAQTGDTLVPPTAWTVYRFLSLLSILTLSIDE
jgi:hypothetical protein